MGTKRDIYNHLGQKIGELELPNETTEEQWAEKLSPYAIDPDEVVSTPNVTPRQIRQALVLSGVSMESVDAAIASLPEPMHSMAKIEWEYSTMFIRSNKFVAQIGYLLGWNSSQLDNLWQLASTL